VAGTFGLLGKGAAALALKANPHVAETLLQEGLTASPMGLNQLWGKIKRLGNETRALATAGGRGRSLRADQVANAIEAEVLNELGNSSTALQDPVIKKGLARLKQQFLAGKGGKISFPDAHKFAGSAGTEAQPMFVRLENGQRIQMPSDPIKNLWKLAEAKVLRTALESPSALGTKYAELMARQSRLVELKNILAPETNAASGFGAQAVAAARNPIASTIAGAGLGAAIPEGSAPGSRLQHALIGAGISNPLVMSLLGQFLANPASAALLRQSPRIVGQALQ